MLGSLTHPDRAVRRKAIAHHVECVEIMRQTGSKDLKLWLPDGLNYPGQDDLRERQDRLADSLQQIYAALDPDHRLLLEYKFFEPYFYATDIPDWGTSLLHCMALGERAQVVLDTGHHAPNTNIEFIVMMLLRQGRLGAFDFNSRFYADDDLMVGAADPFQLFRILHEIVSRGRAPAGVRRELHARPVPQHRAEDPGSDPLGTQRARGDWPRRCLVDEEALRAAQRAGDVLGANGDPHGRVRHRRAGDCSRISARSAACPATRSPPTRRPATRSRSPPSGSAASRPAGAPDPARSTRTEGSTTRGRRVATPVQDLIARSNRLGADPANTNYAGGNTSAKGTAVDPATSKDVELVWVKGSGGDLGTLEGVAACRCCGSTGCALSSTSTRASTARTRWSPRSTTASSARAARRRRSTPPCTASWTPRTSTTCTPTPGSRWPPPRTAGSSPSSASATGWCGCRGAARGSSSASTSPRSRRRTRRRSASSSAATGSRRGARPARSARRTRSRSSAPPASSSTRTASTSPSAPSSPATSHCPRPSGMRRRPRSSRRSAGWRPRTPRRSGTTRTATPSSSSWPGRSSPRSPSAARRARTTSCGPRSSRSSSTCRAPRARRRSSAG